MIEIRVVHPSDDMREVRRLFLAYSESLDIDLGFQGFDDELARLPGKYAPPDGRLLLAWDDDVAVGCVALRPISVERCEMKRLYVAPQARGRQLGRQLVERVCREAREIGYRRIFLDTLSTMTAAQALYRSLGFQPTDPYVYNPISGANYFALDLSGNA